MSTMFCAGSGVLGIQISLNVAPALVYLDEGERRWLGAGYRPRRRDHRALAGRLIDCIKAARGATLSVVRAALRHRGSRLFRPRAALNELLPNRRDAKACWVSRSGRAGDQRVTSRRRPGATRV
jgi:hypothetical protein